MIENMRKYTGLMAVVLILLAAGLVLTMQPAGSGGGGVGDDFLRVNEDTMSQKQFSKEGAGTLRMISAAGPNMMEYPFAMGVEYMDLLTRNYSDKSLVNFVSNRLLLKQAAAKLGIYPSTDAAEEYIQSNLFKNRDGEFDAETYDRFIEGIGSNGFEEKDFKALVAEYLVFIKTRDVIGGGLVAPKESVIAEYRAQQQKVDLLTVSFEADKYKPEIQPSEEEIKTFWNERKEKYLTERELKISYVLAQAPTKDKPVMPKIEPGTETAVAAKMRLDHQQALEKYNAERQVKVDELLAKFVSFIEFSADTNYEQFEKPAEENGLTVVKTEFFTQKNTPAEIKNLNTTLNGKLDAALFTNKFGETAAYKTVSFELTPDGHIAIRLDGEKKPEPKTFEAAKEEATKDLINKLAKEKMEKEAKEAKEALVELLKSGKSFEEAAKEKELKVVPVGPFGAQDKPARAKDSTEFFRVASVTTPGEIAEELAITSATARQQSAADTASIIFVKDRTFEVKPNNAANEAEQLSARSNQLKFSTFQVWFGKLRQDADMKLPKTE